MLRQAALLCSLLIASGIGLCAANLTGIWTGQSKDRNGDMQDLSFRFTETAGVLTGKMYGDNESTPLADAKITGDRITFAVTTELNGQITTFIYTGIIKGDEIEMTRERAGAKPDPDKVVDKQTAQKQAGQKQTFQLKRVI